MLENPWLPDHVKYGITPKQAEFLTYEGREALFGGAAGGGKSVALLVAAMQYAELPGYSALLLRRTYKQLSKADSILAKAKEWLLGRSSRDGRVRWNGDEHKFTFPRGATLEFGHMDRHDAIYDYQGGSWAFVGADEATQFTETMLAYPRTRQRRVLGSAVPIRWRGASNPGGIGHDYVKSRYVKGPDGTSPATPDRQFFPATLDDNPHIDREDYVRQLRESGVDPLTLARLLGGDWDAVPGGRFQPGWFRYFMRRGDYLTFDERRSYHLFNQCRIFLTVDPAASEKNTADYTVISAWAVTPVHDLCWLGCHRGQWEIPDIVPQVESQYRRWRARYCAIEAVAANAAVYQIARRTAMVTAKVSPESRDKLVRATPAMKLASDGRVWLPAREADPTFPLEDVLAEVTRFTGDDDVDAHDDIVDTLSYAVELLDRLPVGAERRQVPMVLGG